ncbi:MAG: ATP-binding cassette domain-containing protein, partial [Anaerolineae bacterium]|nr:ATP-binding cassette domain-containing protein [Anaerolineae bacterium]
MEQQHPLVRLWLYARPHRRQMIIATLFSILNKVFDLAPPLLIGMAVDIVVKRENSWIAALGFEDVSTQLWILAGLTVIIWSLESLFDYLLSVVWRNLAQTIQHDIRVDAYGHVQELELAYFEDQSTGGLMSILNDDVNQLERFLNVGANDIIQVITTVLVIGGMFFYFAPSVAWIGMLPMPIIVWGSLRFQKYLAPRYAAVREQAGMLNGFLANNLSGVATIKSFTAEDYEVERIRRESDRYRQNNRRAIQLSSAFIPMIRMVIVMGFIALMVGGGELVMQGRLEVGAYSVMVYFIQRLLWPLTRLGETFDLYQRAMASIHRVLNLLHTQPEIVDGEKMLEQVDGEIVFENVTFAYKERDSVLQRLSLKMPAGETSAIVGATGAGKSTIVKLLLRFYEVQKGRILLDGHDLRDLNLKDLRSRIG